jgi:hypothetical protein
MSELYNRDFSMRIGGQTLEIQEADPILSDKTQPTLKVEFAVEKNSNKDPNRADITVYNFNLANRATLEQGSKLIDTLRQATPPLIFCHPVES